MLTLVRPLQVEKAKLPMLVTLCGMMMPGRLIQLVKAAKPMLVILSGIVMLVIWEQP